MQGLRKKQITITFQPDPVSISLLEKVLREKGGIRGMKTHLINSAIRNTYASYAGKRERALMESK